MPQTSLNTLHTKPQPAPVVTAQKSLLQTSVTTLHAKAQLAPVMTVIGTLSSLSTEVEAGMFLG